jgi:hypothetical protein
MIEREKVDTRMYSLSSIQDWAQGNGTGDSADDLSDDAARKAISEASPYHFLFDADSIFSQAVEAIQGPLPSVSNSSAEAREEGKPLRESEELSFSPFVATYASTVTFVEQHITNDLDEVSRVIQCPDPLWELYDSFGAPE